MLETSQFHQQKKGTQYKELRKCRSDHKVFNSTPTSETYHQQKNPMKFYQKKSDPKGRYLKCLLYAALFMPCTV